MFEERLKDIIGDVYCGRVIVFSNYTARETLYAKGISPAIFLHKYYAQMTSDLRISYSIKEKTIRQMFQICPIDAEEYDCLKDEKLNKVLRERILTKSKLPRQFKKEELDSKPLIENYLKSLNYFWFEEASKTFIYAMSLEEGNFKLSTLQQPIGIVFLLEMEKGQSIKTEYQKLRKEVENKMKKMFVLNSTRIKNIPTAAIILHNIEKGISQEQCQSHIHVLKQQYRFESSLLCRIEINSPSAKDSVDWSSYPRSILKIDYKLKASDPIRLFGENEDVQLKNFIFNHRQKIRSHIEERIRYLGFRYEENNTTKNKFINFFKGSSSIQRTYTAEQVQTRQIADFLFLMGDYKRSLDIYKDLAQKFESNDRDQLIFYNICEMIQLAKCINAFIGGQRMKAYESIKSHAQKTMLKRAHGIGKQKIYRYLVYVTYFLHGFRVFDKDFIKNSFYYYIKKGVNDQTLSQQNQNPSIIPALIHEQYANINLLYPIPEYRRYGYDIVRVASKFNQFRLHDHHLRCLLIASYIYKNTFPIIQKYINSSLSRTYLELKKYRFSVERIQLTWKNLINMYQDVPLPQIQQENQFSKLYNTQLRALSEIERAQPHQLTRQTDDCIQVPKLSDLKIDVIDEKLQNNQSLGSKWQDVGDVFLGQPELTSKGMSKQNMVKSLKMFDSITAQQKQLACRIKGLGSGPFTEPIIKRNARCAFVGEPITFSFALKNPLPINIDVTNIQLHLKVNRKCKIVQKEPSSQKLVFKSGQKMNVVFQIIPEEAGVYEFSHITWTFFKMTSIYRFMQPWQSKSNLKSLYYKLNVLENCGKLQVKMHHSPKIYQGQMTELEIVVKNEGSQLIDQIYLAIDNFNIFGFKLKRFQIAINPGQSQILRLKAKMPILKTNNYLKCITKTIFLYRTAGQFRVQRAVTCFNIERIAEIKDITCERISKSLLFLSFSLKYPSSQKVHLSLLKSLIIQGGFQIKKVETNNLQNLCHYFFFLRKSQQNRHLEQFKLTSHSSPALSIITQYATLNKQPLNDENQVRNKNKMRLYFWWSDSQGHEGVIDPQPIAITATEGQQNKTRLPFNVKIQMHDEIWCNLEQEAFVEVQVEYSIKNIYADKDIKVTVQFRDGDLNDLYWQGKTNHQITLKFNQERKFKLKLIIMRIGIFNIARNIKYFIFTNKTNSYPITHDDYESVYLQAKDYKNKTQPNNFDFFGQFEPTLFKKINQAKEPVQQNYDLI